MTEIATKHEQGLFTPLVEFFVQEWGPAWERAEPELSKLGRSDEITCLNERAPEALELAQWLESLEHEHMATIDSLVRAVEHVNAAYEQVCAGLEEARVAGLTDSVDLGTGIRQFGKCVAGAAELLAPLRESPADPSLLINACEHYEGYLSEVSPDAKTYLGYVHTVALSILVSRNEVMHLALVAEILVREIAVRTRNCLNYTVVNKGELTAIHAALSAITSKHGIVAGVIAILDQVRADPPAAYDVGWLDSTHRKFADLQTELRTAKARVIHRTQEGSADQDTMGGSSSTQPATFNFTVSDAEPAVQPQSPDVSWTMDVLPPATDVKRLKGPRPRPVAAPEHAEGTSREDEPLIEESTSSEPRSMGARLLGALTTVQRVVTAPIRLVTGKIARLRGGRRAAEWVVEEVSDGAREQEHPRADREGFDDETMNAIRAKNKAAFASLAKRESKIPFIMVNGADQRPLALLVGEDHVDEFHAASSRGWSTAGGNLGIAVVAVPPRAKRWFRRQTPPAGFGFLIDVAQSPRDGDHRAFIAEELRLAVTPAELQIRWDY